MVLLLTVMQSPNSALGEQRLIQASGFVIGRGSDCDWTLPDPDRRISNRHCAVELFEGQWHLRDLSSNGTFLNTTPEPIGRGQMRPLRYGDRIRLGAYELECRLQVDAASAKEPWQAEPTARPPIAPPALHGDIFAASLPGLSPAGGIDRDFAPMPSAAMSAMPPLRATRNDDAFSAPLDSFPPPAGAATPQVEQPALTPMPLSADTDIFSAPLPGLSPAGGQEGGHAPVLPTDFDPFGPEDAGPAMPDHQPAVQDLFTPPRATMPDLLPGDWNAPPQTTPPRPADIFSPPASPADHTLFAPLAPGLGMPGPAPDHQPLPSPQATMPAPQATMPALLPDDWDLSPTSLPAPSAATNISTAPPGNPFAAAPPPLPAPAARPTPRAEPQVMTAPPGAELGIGLPQPPPMAPQQTMTEHQTAIVLLSAAVAGMRALLTASEEAKRALGNQPLMPPANALDPLRFTAGDEAIAMAMLGGAPTAAGASKPSAAAGSLDDLNAHKLATMAASKAAARALMARLSPATLEAEEPSGGFMPGARQKRLWKSYQQLHQQMAEDFDDDFDFAFRKAFAQAYDEASRIVDKGSK
ncbi:type VI secretion system-associated FHA domain protein [Rhodovarius sp.]|uniref:type VI secretion system-associated FHA domain protein n=1 Tax=Rhodovarius sp. TaxID=2972673 RepID=UPI00334105B9